jgi:hypothetical protein
MNQSRRPVNTFVSRRSVGLLALLSSLSVAAPANATYQVVTVTKIQVHSSGAAQIWVASHPSFAGCEGGAGRAHLGTAAWAPASAALLSVAMQARDTGVPVTVNLELSGNYCLVDVIRFPS